MDTFLNSFKCFRSRRSAFKSIYLTTLLLFLCGLTLHAVEQQQLRFATAPAGTNYHQLFNHLKPLLLKEAHIDIKNIMTQGSIENINLIEEHKVSLALAQNDTVFMAINGLKPFKRAKENFSAILPLYEEPIYFLTNNPAIYTIDQLTYKRVNVGLKESGLLESVKVILKSSNKWSQIKKLHLDNKTALKKLARHEIDALFINELSGETQQLINEQKIFAVSLDDSLIEQLQKTYTYFTKYTHNNIQTIANTTLLICNNTLDRKLIAKITTAIYNHPPTKESELFIKSKSFSHYLDAIPLHEEAINTLNRLRGIQLFKIQTILLILLSTLILLILSWIAYSVFILKNNLKTTLFISKRSLLITIHNTIKFTKRHKYYSLLTLYLASYILLLLLIKVSEHHWAIQQNIISPLDGKSFIEIVTWIFVLSFTGSDGGFFPLSTEAQILISFIPIINTSAVILLLGLLSSDKIKKVIKGFKGMKIKEFKNHIIICGWNHKGDQLIKELLHENIVNKNDVVVLCDHEQHKDVLQSYQIDYKNAYYIKGSALNKEDLKSVDLAQASSIIILSDPELDDSDTIMKVLTVNKSGFFPIDAKIELIAEVRNTQNISLAYDAGATQVVSLGDIESKVFIQAIRNPGVSKFIDEVFEVNDDNDLYSYKIEKGSSLLGQTYDQALLKLRELNILLLAINIEANRTKDEVDLLLEKFSLRKAVITNPFSTIEKSYKIQGGDSLILLAQYEKDVYNIK